MDHVRTAWPRREGGVKICDHTGSRPFRELSGPLAIHVHDRDQLCVRNLSDGLHMKPGLLAGSDNGDLHLAASPEYDRAASSPAKVR